MPLSIFRVYSFIYLIHKYLLCACYVPGSFLITEAPPMNGTNENPYPLGGRWTVHEQIMYGDKYYGEK